MSKVYSIISEKIVLGTVQFGTDYGITNLHGAPTKNKIFDILDFAWQNGIKRFDTAPGYGSENLLGDFITTNGLQKIALVSTKIPSLKEISNFKNHIRVNIEKSLNNLGCPIDVLFFHDPSDSILLKKNPNFFENILKDYPITKIGVSVYEPEEVELLRDCSFELAFQFPFNLFDRRFEKVKMVNGNRYARSIFLQGILASSGDLRGNPPKELYNFHKKFHENLIKLNINPLGAAFLFVVKKQFIDYFLIGVDTKQQLNDILSLDLDNQSNLFDLEEFNMDFKKICNDPREWS